MADLEEEEAEPGGATHGTKRPKQTGITIDSSLIDTAGKN